MLERCDTELQITKVIFGGEETLSGIEAHLFSCQKLVYVFMLNKRILQETGALKEIINMRKSVFMVPLDLNNQ